MLCLYGGRVKAIARQILLKIEKPLSFFIENALIRGAGFLTIVILLLIVAFVLKEALPFLSSYSFSEMMTGSNWIPLSGVYGVLPLLVGSALITLVAAIVGIPLALGTALFISEIATNRVRSVLKISLEILASIPSVVFGFLGIIFLGPFVESVLGVHVGTNAFTAGVLLAIMAIPTIASVAEESLQAVPKSLREASLALGASKLQTMLKTTFHSAFSGIFAGIMLGVGRAIGETMTVMMVAGGAAQITANIFKPVRTITGTIAAEMGEVIYDGQHYQALFFLGLMIYAKTFIINTISGYVVSSVRSRHE